jgi:Tol biopolymer transport system component
MKRKIIFIITLFFFSLIGCNESRIIEPPLEQKRPQFDQVIQPKDQAFAYNKDADIIMNFSEPMDVNTFSGNFYLWEDSNKTKNIEGTFTADGNKVIFNPNSSLMEAHEYFIELLSRVKDVNGNGIDKDTVDITQTEFFTSGKYSKNLLPEFFICTGSEDLLLKTSVKEQLLDADTVLNLGSFGRQLEIAFTRDGSKIIMSDYNASNSGIYFIDPVTFQITKKITQNNNGAAIKKTAEIVVGNKFAYVINQSGKLLSKVDLPTEEVIATVELPGTPKGMAISNDFSKIYIGSVRDNQIWVVDAVSYTLVNTITVEGLSKTIRLAVSTDDKYLIIREFRGNKLIFVETQTGNIATTLDLGYEAKSGNNNDLAVAGNFVYVSSSEGYLTKINTITQTVEAQIVNSNIQGIDIYPDSEVLIATLRETPAKLAVILPESLKIIRLIELGKISPWDVAIRPNKEIVN